jgi:hypothetical protein
MEQWHITDKEYIPETHISFDNLKSTDIVYQKGSPEQIEKVNELYSRLKNEEDIIIPIETATLAQLRFMGLGGELISEADQLSPLGILPNGRYRCCGYFYTHPGCYYGPVKHEMTPWKLVPDDFHIRVWETNDVKSLWNSPIVKGTYHLIDPTPVIETLKRNLADSVVNAVETVKRNGEKKKCSFFFLPKKL